MKTAGRKHLYSRKEMIGIRKEALERLDKGESPEKVIDSYGLHRSVIYDWIKNQERIAKNGFSDRCRTGRKKTISDSVLRWLFREMLAGKRGKARSAVWHQGKAGWVVEMLCPKLPVRIHITKYLEGRMMREFGLAFSRPWNRLSGQPRRDFFEIRRKAESAGRRVIMAEVLTRKCRFHREKGKASGGVAEGKILPTAKEKEFFVIAFHEFGGLTYFRLTRNKVSGGIFRSFLEDFLDYRSTESFLLFMSNKAKCRFREASLVQKTQKGRVRVIGISSPNSLAWHRKRWQEDV